jgi:uncharacterized protein YhbP (UPF0306 family)
MMTDAPTSYPRLERIARAVIEANKYMTLATADDAGRPWASPVYYTPEGHDVFYWASSPDSVHSRNLAQRPELSIVIFDSQAEIGAADAVYMIARADIVPDDELDRCAATYGSRFPELRVFHPDELRGTRPAAFVPGQGRRALGARPRQRSRARSRRRHPSRREPLAPSERGGRPSGVVVCAIRSRRCIAPG